MKMHWMVVAALGLYATGGASLAQTPMQRMGKAEGQLNVLAWPGYFERGLNDKRFDWVTGFEKASGCKVNVKTAGTSDEMVALMNEGGIDLVTASGDASTRLIRAKKVQPLNVSLIPSYRNIDLRLQKARWHFEGNMHYGVPYQWGWNVLMYNTKVFGDKKPVSLATVFEEQTLPDGKSNKGRVQAFDGPMYIADAALYLMRKNPELGIKDPYELNEVQYKAALDALRSQRKLVLNYWHDAFAQIDDFLAEKAVVSNSWQFQANILLSKKAPVATLVPVEGATGWADSTMLHAEAKNPHCAYLWLEHSLNPKLQGDLAAWFGSVPAVSAACTGNALLGETGCERQGFSAFDRISFWRTPTTQCSSQANKCVPYYKWVTDYTTVLGGR